MCDIIFDQISSLSVTKHLYQHSDEGLSRPKHLLSKLFFFYYMVFNLPLSIILYVLYTNAAHTSLLTSSIFFIIARSMAMCKHLFWKFFKIKNLNNTNGKTISLISRTLWIFEIRNFTRKSYKSFPCKISKLFQKILTLSIINRYF
jgi:hypothetical protein